MVVAQQRGSAYVVWYSAAVWRRFLYYSKLLKSTAGRAARASAVTNLCEVSDVMRSSADTGRLSHTKGPLPHSL